MTFQLHYSGQLTAAAAFQSERVEFSPGETLPEILARLAADGRSIAYRPLVLTSEGKIQPTLLLILGDEQFTGDRNSFTPEDGSEITLMPPMAGG